MKAELFIVIDFSHEHPVPLVMGGKKPPDRSWKITPFEKLHQEIKQKRFFPERIFVPFAWYWLAKDRGDRFTRKRANDHPGVYNTLRKLIKQEAQWNKNKEGDSAYHSMECFQLVFKGKDNKKGIGAGLLKQCFKATSVYIKLREPEVIHSDRIHMLPSDKVEKKRGLVEASLRTLDKGTIDEVKLSNKSKEDRKRIERVCEYLESDEFAAKMVTLTPKERKVPAKLRCFLIGNCLKKYNNLTPEQRRPLLLAKEDFAPEGYVFRRHEVDETKEALSTSNIVVVKGENSSGKSTVIKHVGYELDKDEDKLVFLIDPRVRTKLAEATDFYPLQGENLHILVDDAHMKEMEAFIEDICDSNIECKLLIGMRRFSPLSKLTTFLDLYKHLPFELSVTKEIKDGMISRVSKAKGLNKEDIELMLNKELPSWEDDLLNLAFGLQVIEKKGKLNQENLLDAIESRVTTVYLGKQRIKHAERVLFVLSIFYQYEIPVMRRFVQNVIDREADIIDELIERGEIIEDLREGLLSMQHSSLGRLYLNYFREYPRSVKDLMLELRGEYSNWVEGAFRQYLNRFPDETGYIVFRLSTDAYPPISRFQLHLPPLMLSKALLEERDYEQQRKLIADLMTDSVVVHRFIQQQQGSYPVDPHDALGVFSSNEGLANFLAGSAVTLFHCLFQENIHLEAKRKRFKDNLGLLLETDSRCRNVYKLALERGMLFKDVSELIHRMEKKPVLPFSLTAKTLLNFLDCLDQLSDRRQAMQNASRFYHSTFPYSFHWPYDYLGIFFLNRTIRILAYANVNVARRFIQQLDFARVLDVAGEPLGAPYFGSFLGNLGVIDRNLARQLIAQNQQRIEKMLTKVETIFSWRNFVGITRGLLLANREVTLAIIKSIDFWKQLIKRIPLWKNQPYPEGLPFLTTWFAIFTISLENEDVAFRLVREYYEREMKIVLKSLKKKALAFLARNNVSAIYELSKFVGIFVHYGLITTERIPELVPLQDFYERLGARDFATVLTFISQGVPEVLAALPIRTSPEAILRQAYKRAFTFGQLKRIQTTWCSPKRGRYSHIAHYPTCGLDYFRKLSQKDLVICRSRREVFEAGKLPCRICNCEVLFREFPSWE